VAPKHDPLATGGITYAEIVQQFELWPDTLNRIIQWRSQNLSPRRPLITGAGSSAYAASAVHAAFSGSFTAPTTDLLLNASLIPSGCDALISLGRSGDSPESLGVVRLIQREHPALKQFSITCNSSGSLANATGVTPILLDPRTNDRGLAMTSSFSNMVLAGIALQHADSLVATAERLQANSASLLNAAVEQARHWAHRAPSRVVVLGSNALFPLAREAALKITELTAGSVVAVAETFLGLRHGPMSFLREDTIVLCFFSSNAATRRYEIDLFRELEQKRLGVHLAIAAEDWLPPGIACIPPLAPELPDMLRTPFEIVFAQLFAFFLSVELDMNPDEPSPSGVINRVVQGVRIYEP
jgi:tagatose-6-phosphate ketose/aldose isomerase